MSDSDKSSRQNVLGAVSASAKSAAATVGAFVKKGIDYQVEAKIAQISDVATTFVMEKIHAALYKDPTRYGLIAGTQQRVDIYNVNSQVLNNVMKAATGCSIDEFINGLPIGVKQVAGIARTKLENTIANVIIQQLTNLSIKPLIAKILHEGYGFTQEQIHAYLGRTSEETHPSEDTASEIQELLKDRHIQAATKTKVDEKALTQNNTADGISLADVIKYYQYKVELHLNETLRNAIIEAAAQAAKSIAKTTAENAIDYSAFATAGGALLTTPVLGPVAGVAGLGVATLTNQVKNPVVMFSGEEAYKKVKQVAERLVPQEVTKIHHEYGGRTHEENVLIDAGNGEEWEFHHIDIITPTFSHWVSDKCEAAKSKCFQLLGSIQNHWSGNPRDSNIPPIQKHWLRDNDFPKLNAIRNAYVHAQNKLNDLDLTLMNLCEFASGIRTEVDGEPFDYEDVTQRAEGLAKCQEKLDFIRQEIVQIRHEATRAAQRNADVENSKRRRDLVDPANATLDKLVKEMNAYAEKVQAVIFEAQKMTQEESIAKATAKAKA